MQFTVVTLFPNLIEGFLAEGLVALARDRGLVHVTTVNPRAFTSDAHHTVDDKAFGGGDGMVMKFEPLAAAIESARTPESRVSVLTPQGRRWDQKLAREWSDAGVPRILVCGRYAGIDQRLIERVADDEISLGDFVLNGGEIAALAIIESVARLRPGALGNAVSGARDSFSDGRLECPQFTRPREVGGLPVPAPLLSGHHRKIREFEDAVSLVRTPILRPDLDVAGDIRNALGQLAELSELELEALGIERGDLSRLQAGLK